MKTAVFGGTFNPIHIGHISVIKSVMKELSPDRLILMPTHIPPHKPEKDLASGCHRLQMCRLAAKGFSRVYVSDYEVNQEGKSYTVNTLEHLKTVYPDDELYFIMGSDMLKTFPSWYRSERIAELATLVVFARTAEDAKSISSDSEKIMESGAKCIVLNCVPVAASSTDVRARIMAYSDAGGYVPKDVEEYIIKNKLYNFDKSKYNSYVDYLCKNLSEKRFAHSVNVANEALRLAVVYGCDRDKAYFAGLVHDICKEIPYDEQLSLVKRSKFEVDDVELAAPKTYHGIAGAVYLEEHFGIKDRDVLSAIRYHTVAKGGMTLLEKIIYIADLISVERDYKDVGYIRECTYKDINLGMYEAMKFSVGYSCTHTRTIPLSTLMAYNEFTCYKLSLEQTNN